jgi:hypothetical protein
MYKIKEKGRIRIYTYLEKLKRLGVTCESKEEIRRERERVRRSSDSAPRKRTVVSGRGRGSSGSERADWN